MSEDLEVLKLKAKAKAKAARERESLSVEETRDEYTLPKAALGGAVEKLPGAKHAYSGLETIGDIVTGDVDIENSYEAYKQNLQENEDTLRDLETKHPYAFGAGEFITTVGLATALGPANIARQAALAGAQAYSKYDDVKMAFWHAGMGGFLTKLGIEAPKAISALKSKMSPAIGRMADETSLSVVKPKGDAATVMRLKQLIKKRYNGDANKAAKHVEEIVDLKLSQSPDDLALNSEAARQRIGKQIGDTLDTVDEHLKALGKGEDKVINGGILQAELKNTVGGNSRFMSDSSVPAVLRPSFSEIDQFIDDITLIPKTTRRNVFNKVEMVDPQTGGKIVDYKPAIEETSEIVAREFSAKDIFDTKVRMANQIEDIFEKKLIDKTLSKSDRMKISIYKSKMVGKLADKLDDALGSSLNKLSDPNAEKAIKEFTELNQKFGMASHIATMAKEESLRKLHMNLFERGSALIGFKGFFLSAIGGVAQGPAGFAAGLTLNHIMRHPSTPIKLARQMRSLADYAARNPDNKIITQFFTALNTQTDPEIMEQVLDLTLAKAHADDNPIERTVDSVYENADVISTIIRDEAGDELASQFNSAIETHDDAAIGSLMEQASKLPGASRYIKGGRGWGGLIHSMDDKIKISTEIEKMDISRLQKSKLKQGLKLNSDEPGVIPQVQQEPERFFKAKTRDKTRPQY